MDYPRGGPGARDRREHGRDARAATGRAGALTAAFTFPLCLAYDLSAGETYTAVVAVQSRWGGHVAVARPVRFSLSGLTADKLAGAGASRDGGGDGRGYELPPVATGKGTSVAALTRYAGAGPGASTGRPGRR